MAKELPSPKAKTGRPSYSNIELLPGILRVMRSGMRWRDLDNPCFPSDTTHWRRLRFWGSRLSLKRVWDLILTRLDKANKIDLSIASIDGSLIQSYNFLDTTGYSGKYCKTGTKISTLVDFPGIPLNVVFAPGEKHDSG